MFGNTNQTGFGFGAKPSGGFGQTSGFGSGTSTAGQSGFGFGSQPAGQSTFGQSTTAPQGGLFGNSAQKPAFGTGGFGSNTASTGANTGAAAGTSSGFGTGSTGFGNTTGGFGFGQKPQSGTQTGLFGSSTTGGGLFGKSQAAGAQNTQETGTGLFGQQGTNQGSTGGLFGQSNQAGQAGTQAGTQTGGLFGGGQSGQTGSLFGRPQTQPGQTGQTGGLFGQTQTQQPGSSLFGQSNTQPAQTGGLFGQSATQPTQTGGLFGQSSTQPAQSGGLFGQSSTQPAQTGGLFGQSQPASQNTGLFGQAAKPATGGLFGSAQPAQTAQTGQSGGLFGSSNTATTGGLFGAKPATGGLFGNTTGGTGLFGAQQQTQQAAPSLFGNAAQPVAAPAQPLNVTPFTRISDLPEQYQKEIEAVDSYITTQIRISDEIASRQEEHKTMVTSVPRDASLLLHKLKTAVEALVFDDSRLRELKEKVRATAGEAEHAFDAFNNLSASTPAGLLQQRVDRRNESFLPYFADRYNIFADTIDQLAAAIRDVNNAVADLERQGPDGPRTTTDPQQIAPTLRDEYAYFMSLSDRVAELHQSVERLRR